MTSLALAAAALVLLFVTAVSRWKRNTAPNPTPPSSEELEARFLSQRLNGQITAEEYQRAMRFVAIRHEQDLSMRRHPSNI